MINKILTYQGYFSLFILIFLLLINACDTEHDSDGSEDIRKSTATMEEQSGSRSSENVSKKLFPGLHFIQSLSITDGEKYLAAGGFGGRIKVWSIKQTDIVLKDTLTRPTPSRSILQTIDFSTSGKYLASATSSGYIYVRKKINGQWKMIEALPAHKSSVNCVDFRPNSNILISASSDKTVKAWQIKKGKVQHLHTLTKHDNKVFSVAIGSDGRYFASGSGRAASKLEKGDNLQESSEIHLWFFQNGSVKHLDRVSDPIGNIFALDFAPQADHLAYGTGLSNVGLYEITNEGAFNLVDNRQGHDMNVWSITFGSNGKYLVSGSADKTVHIWKVKAKSRKKNRKNEKHIVLDRVLKGHSKSVKSVVVTPETNLVVSGSEDRTIQFWDVLQAE